MTGEDLRALQAPLKEKYRETPQAAVVTLKAQGRLGDGVSCRVDTHAGEVKAGLHPATGGDGTEACSADMLLEALAACAGVTLRAVATAIGLNLKGGTVTNSPRPVREPVAAIVGAQRAAPKTAMHYPLSKSAGGFGAFCMALRVCSLVGRWAQHAAPLRTKGSPSLPVGADLCRLLQRTPMQIQEPK
jgi:hypothetical protein